MTNTKLTTVLTEAVKEVIEHESDIVIDDGLKDNIWNAISTELNKEVY